MNGWKRPRNGPESYVRRVPIGGGLSLRFRWWPKDEGIPAHWRADRKTWKSRPFPLGAYIPDRPWPMGQVPNDLAERLDKVLKAYYRPAPIKNLVYRDSPLLSLITKQRRRLGQDLTVPVVTYGAGYRRGAPGAGRGRTRR